MRSQPSWNSVVGELGPSVVAGRHRRAADLELADLALGARRPGLGIDDADLEPGHRLAEQRQPADVAVGVGGSSTGAA